MGKKRVFAALLALAVTVGSLVLPARAAFTDTTGHWAETAITKWSEEYSIINGYEDGTFRPAQAVTRAEAVRILNGALGRQPDEEAIDQVASVSPFADVSLGHWAYYEILEASQSHDFTQEGQGERWTL